MSINDSNAFYTPPQLLDDLLKLPISPLMLLKQPDLVLTIKKLRRYVGPASLKDPRYAKLPQ